ncbi:Dabb family protein [Oscillospiraceae bacterium PP1C4]
MVKHIAMWKLEDVAEGNDRDENAKRIKKGLEDLTGVIDGIIKLEVGINFNPKGYDLALYSEFESAEALNAYGSHPDHVRMREFIRKVITEQVVADYEM